MGFNKTLVSICIAVTGMLGGPAQATAQSRTTVYSANQNFAGYPYYRVVTGNVLSASRDSRADQIAMKATTPLYGISGYLRVFLKAGDLALLQTSLGRSLRPNENVTLGLMCSYNRDISLGYQAGGWLIIGSTCRYRFVRVVAPETPDIAEDPLTIVKMQLKKLNQDVLGSASNEDQFDYHANLIAHGHLTLEQQRVSISFSHEAERAIDNLYVSLLKRNATHQELEQRQYELAYLNGSLAQIKTSIMNGAEYQRTLENQQPVYDSNPTHIQRQGGFARHLAEIARSRSRSSGPAF